MSGVIVDTSGVSRNGGTPLARFNGTVKFFNPDRGYGFIRREGGQDVFVHANELRKSGIVDLEPIKTGSRLAFAVEMVAGKGPKAIDIVMVAEEA